MQLKILLAYLILFCTTGHVSAQQKDSIFLNRGTVLIGEVQGASLGSITIDDIDLKIQKVKLYKIKMLRIQRRFKIETTRKELYRGMLKSSDKEGWVNIKPDEGGEISIPITSLFELIPLDQNFFKRLNGSVSAGLSYTKSSNLGQVNFSTDLRYATRLFDYQLTASELGSIDSGKYSRDNEDAQLFVAYDLTPVWFLATFLEYQRNLELSVARRFIETLGGGNKVFVKQDWQLLAITGISLTQEKSTVDVPNRTSLELPFMLRFNYYHPAHPNITVSSYQTVYFNLSEAGRIRYSGSTNFSWELVRYFYLTISPYTNYDNKPPSNSNNKFDYGIVLSISYKF